MICSSTARTSHWLSTQPWLHIQPRLHVMWRGQQPGQVTPPTQQQDARGVGECQTSCASLSGLRSLPHPHLSAPAGTLLPAGLLCWPPCTGEAGSRVHLGKSLSFEHLCAARGPALRSSSSWGTGHSRPTPSVLSGGGASLSDAFASSSSSVVLRRFPTGLFYMLKNS